MNNLSPIVLFVYNRPEHTLKTLTALSQNYLADKSDLWIFADGPKEDASLEQLEYIKKTREVIKYRKWCKKVEIIISEKNKGLALSIINGITDIINKSGKVIVLEDDIVTGKYFLTFMNDALKKYENEKNIWHITGWNENKGQDNSEKCFFYPLMDCWGWATWFDRWVYFKKEPEMLIKTFSKEMIKRLNVNGLSPLWLQVLNNCNGGTSTWAVFWHITIFLQDGLCLGPCSSLVNNIGRDGSGVHRETHKYQEIMNIDHKITVFPDTIRINDTEYNKIKHHYKKQFKWLRLYYLIRTNERLSWIYKFCRFLKVVINKES
jgi:hypothetical protein